MFINFTKFSIFLNMNIKTHKQKTFHIIKNLIKINKNSIVPMDSAYRFPPIDDDPDSLMA